MHIFSLLTATPSLWGSSAIWRAFLVSALLHAGLFFALSGSGESDDSDAVITIGVEYQHGDSAAGGEQKRRQVVKRESEASTRSAIAPRADVGQSAGAGFSGTTNTAEAIDGEAIGLKAQYPRLSRTLGEAGRVQIEVRRSEAHDRAKTANERVSVRVSSGFKRLDESAQKAIEVALNDGSLQRFFKDHESLLINFVFRLK